MEAVGRHGTDLESGRCMLSASDMPVPEEEEGEGEGDVDDDGDEGEGAECEGSQRKKEEATEVLVLPRWEIISRVTPSRIDAFMSAFVGSSNKAQPDAAANDDTTTPPPTDTSTPKPSLHFPTRPCPHRALILLCSQRRRDARCGQSAPLLRRELERHLRPLGLLRDRHDERPGGVAVLFVSHVGGHRWAGNVLVYRRGAEEELGEGEEGGKRKGGVQCIWLARVRPEDCEGIVKHTVLKGEVVEPERVLRGGFDCGRGVASW